MQHQYSFSDTNMYVLKVSEVKLGINLLNVNSLCIFIEKLQTMMLAWFSNNKKAACTSGSF
jgi:hypothetical protein